MSVPTPIVIPTGALVGAAIRRCQAQWDMYDEESSHLDNINDILDDMIDDAEKENERLDKILSNLKRKNSNMIEKCVKKESNLTPIGEVFDGILRVIIILNLIGLVAFLVYNFFESII